MIRLENISTGKIRVINDVKAQDGVIVTEKAAKGEKFCANNSSFIVVTESNEKGAIKFAPAEGWKLIIGRKRTAKPAKPAKPAPETTADVTPAAETTAEDVVIEEPVVIDDAPAAEPVIVEAAAEEVAAETSDSFEIQEYDGTTQEAVDILNAALNDGTEPADMSRDDVRREIVRKYGEMGGEIFECAARYAEANNKFAADMEKKISYIAEQVAAKVFARYAETKPNVAQIVASFASGNSNEVHVRNFKSICKTVAKNIPVYMYGPAGTGKSHTAKQVAEALGLEFYETSQAQFAHDLKGYGDAAGRYVETPLYKAVTRGGVFHLDECDASAPEAMVVLNSLIANRRFDFPVVGNVVAHPNFRVIASGNTAMTGADEEYTARAVQDASFKNRFMYVKVDYSPEIEEALSHGQQDVVDFCRDLRRAKNEARISLCVSYRQIAQISDPDMQEAWDAGDLLQGAVFKELESDEIRILYNELNDKRNRWAMVMAGMF